MNKHKLEIRLSCSKLDISGRKYGGTGAADVYIPKGTGSWIYRPRKGLAALRVHSLFTYNGELCDGTNLKALGLMFAYL